MNEVDVVFFWV